MVSMTLTSWTNFSAGRTKSTIDLCVLLFENHLYHVYLWFSCWWKVFITNILLMQKALMCSFSITFIPILKQPVTHYLVFFPLYVRWGLLSEYSFLSAFYLLCPERYYKILLFLFTQTLLWRIYLHYIHIALISFWSCTYDTIAYSMLSLLVPLVDSLRV